MSYFKFLAVPGNKFCGSHSVGFRVGTRAPFSNQVMQQTRPAKVAIFGDQGYDHNTVETSGDGDRGNRPNEWFCTVHGGDHPGTPMSWCLMDGGQGGEDASARTLRVRSRSGGQVNMSLLHEGGPSAPRVPDGHGQAASVLGPPQRLRCGSLVQSAHARCRGRHPRLRSLQPSVVCQVSRTGMRNDSCVLNTITVVITITTVYRSGLMSADHTWRRAVM